MKTVLTCKSAEEFLTVLQEFGRVKGYSDKVDGLEKAENDVFVEMETPSAFMKEFLDFVQNNPQHHNLIIKTEVYDDYVVGFDSAESVEEAIELSNKCSCDCWVEDSDWEMAEILCDIGTLYVPKFFNPTHDRLFWLFVGKKDSLEEKILGGREKCL